jgi:putative oxidoreductase
MMPMHSALPAPRHELAVLLLRLFFAAILIYGTQDNVLSTEQMHEFRDFLARNGFPYPLFSAHLSVYAQFICGLLLLAGAATRLAAAVMVVNFIVALAMVHVGLPFSANIAPLSMLALAVFFALHGGGSYSVDAWMGRRGGTEGVSGAARARERVGGAVGD